MTGKLQLGTLLLAMGMLAVPACSASDADGGGGDGTGAGTPQNCVPGTQINCACPAGGEGIQSCLDDGSGYGACNCDGSGGSGGGTGGPCGDAFCDQGDENCRSCPTDCGQCAPCNVAPACPSQGVSIPPAVPEHHPELNVTRMVQVPREVLREQLAEQVAQAPEAMRVISAALAKPQPDEQPLVSKLRQIFGEYPGEAAALLEELTRAGMVSPAEYLSLNPVHLEYVPVPQQTMADEFPGGTIECGSPFLRVGMQKIYVHNPADEDFPSTDRDEVYCLVQSEAQNGGELRVTPVMNGLEEDDEWVLSIEEGVFWGQIGQAIPGSDILATYNCIEDDSDGAAHAALVDAIGEGVVQVGGAVGGDYGWIFTTAGAVAGVVSTAMAANQDDKLFNAQQHIPLTSQLELTNGAYWTVRKSGSATIGNWDWELYIQAWGCAEFGML